MHLLNKIFKFFKLLKYSLWRKGLLNGIAANVELQNMVKDINPETIIDIGSNKGQFIMLIEQLFPHKIIYSFEPIEEVLKKQKRFFNYKKNIFFYNFALGGNSSTKEFFITKRMDSSSFFKVDTKNDKSNYYTIKNKTNIQIRTLDEIIIDQKVVNPILMKIDVQGYEIEVLKGSEKMLEKIDYLLIEVSENEFYHGQPLSNEIITFLQDRNFQILKKSSLTRIYKTNFMQRDILFHNKIKSRI